MARPTRFAPSFETPLIGRVSELGRITTAINETETHGSVVLLVGEAGIGKTRLLDETTVAMLR